MFTSDKFIPYIFIEWELMRMDHEASQCPNLESVISLLKSEGYSAWNLSPLGMIHDNCLHRMLTDVLWIHKDAEPLWDKENDFVNSINCLN